MYVENDSFFFAISDQILPCFSISSTNTSRFFKKENVWEIDESNILDLDRYQILVEKPANVVEVITSQNNEFRKKLSSKIKCQTSLNSNTEFNKSEKPTKLKNSEIIELQNKLNVQYKHTNNLPDEMQKNKIISRNIGDDKVMVTLHSDMAIKEEIKEEPFF